MDTALKREEETQYKGPRLCVLSLFLRLRVKNWNWNWKKDLSRTVQNIVRGQKGKEHGLRGFDILGVGDAYTSLTSIF